MNTKKLRSNSHAYKSVVLCHALFRKHLFVSYHQLISFSFSSECVQVLLLYFFALFALLSHVFTDSFVNSQEWTLSRSVPELRLGIVGSINSGKSALVHRYLTGSYMQEESPEGGRFKKEIFIDNQSFLLLIRDEGGMPEMQVGVFSTLNTAAYVVLEFTLFTHRLLPY